MNLQSNHGTKGVSTKKKFETNIRFKGFIGPHTDKWALPFQFAKAVVAISTSFHILTSLAAIPRENKKNLKNQNPTMSDIKKRKITQTTMMDLSSELLEEILLRVPAKSLAVMKLTCKECKTLIEDPNFVEKQFSRLCGREQQLIVITDVSADSSSSSSGLKVSCIGIDFNRLKEPCLNVDVFTPEYLVKAVFECDGLLVWVMKKNIYILNPMLHRGKVIPVTPRQGYDYCDYAYGLGYVANPSRTTASSNDYKIVKFSCHSTFKLDLWTYDFKSKSWNEVLDKSFDGFYNFPISSVCLRGTPYWLGICKKRGTTIYSIQSFDFEKECFEPLFLPPTTFGWEDSVSLGVFKVDYIFLLHQSKSTPKMNLWVKKEHWDIMMTVVIPEPMIHLCSSYLIENNSKLVIAGSHFETNSVTVYIGGENEESKKLEYRCGTNNIIGGCYYAPSLLMVPGFSR
ncbi:unnamed protein product [Eruca vesicaria subsp. sativa]|uniref:F-box domain-containing protein n=1 Tax=Eruca vesicaria subsp. sativa TaxID=29727 RepID=A0ABC8KTI1_ERUVS|nr:unnamed protein product [Eruca vesicaria subsp. sativa]